MGENRVRITKACAPQKFLLLASIHGRLYSWESHVFKFATFGVFVLFGDKRNKVGNDNIPYPPERQMRNVLLAFEGDIFYKSF